MIRADIWKALILLLVLCVAVSHQKRKKKRTTTTSTTEATTTSTTEATTTTTTEATTTTVDPLHDFDVLVFVQTWPKTFCYHWKSQLSTNECNLPADDSVWQIHGIWPSRHGGANAPEYCRTATLPFEYTQLHSLEMDLITKWNSLREGRSNRASWRYQWNKHGTCTAILEPLDSVKKYFQQGLHFFGLYDMKSTLANKGIRPGRTYTLKKIMDSLKAAVGKNVAVNCIHNFDKNESYLHEVRICFDKKLNLVDCDGIPGYQTNCWKKVVYPNTVPT